MRGGACYNEGLLTKPRYTHYGKKFIAVPCFSINGIFLRFINRCYMPGEIFSVFIPQFVCSNLFISIDCLNTC